MNLARILLVQYKQAATSWSVGSVPFIIHNIISWHSTNYCSCTGQLTTNRRSNTEDFLNSGQCPTSHGTRRFRKNPSPCLIQNQFHPYTHSIFL
jgi:hypothetical protein